MQQQELLAAIWVRLTEKPFTLLALAEQVIHDGGTDIEPLTEGDLTSLMEQDFKGNWRDVAFSCSELLTYYLASEQPLNGGQITAWCFAALNLGEACRREVAEWDREFDFLIRGFEKIRGELKVDEALYILRNALAEKEKL